MRILLIFIITIIFTFSGFTQQDMSLNKAIQIALHNNSDLKKNINNLDSYDLLCMRPMVISCHR